MELTRANSLLVALLFCTALIYTAQSDDSANCVYTVYVRTGSEIKSGTDSNISLRLYDGKGLYLEIPNLEVTSTGPHIHCAKKIFPIEQWLGTDVAPYKLTVLKNFCSKDALLASPKPLESSE